MSERDRALFTHLMAELTSADVPATASLSAIAGMNGVPTKVKLAAADIASRLASGTSLPLALSQCAVIAFSPEYRAFVFSAEETGRLAETFSFLSLREELHAKRKSDAVTVCLYPLIIVIASFWGSVLFLKYSSRLLPNLMGSLNMVTYKAEAMNGFLKANVFLASFAGAFIFFFKKLIGTHHALDLFCALSFLTESDVDLYRALETTLPLVHGDMKCEMQVLATMDALKKGEPLPHAFNSFGKACELSLELAENGSTIHAAFARLAATGEEKEKQTVKRCMDFVEPVVMAAVAVYLIILLKAAIMPVLFMNFL